MLRLRTSILDDDQKTLLFLDISNDWKTTLVFLNTVMMQRKGSITLGVREIFKDPLVRGRIWSMPESKVWHHLLNPVVVNVYEQLNFIIISLILLKVIATFCTSTISVAKILFISLGWIYVLFCEQNTSIICADLKMLMLLKPSYHLDTTKKLLPTLPWTSHLKNPLTCPDFCQLSVHRGIQMLLILCLHICVLYDLLFL